MPTPRASGRTRRRPAPRFWSVRTFANRLWASLCAYPRREALQVKTTLNRFALKAKIRFAAQQAALAAFRKLSTA